MFAGTPSHAPHRFPNMSKSTVGRTFILSTLQRYGNIFSAVCNDFEIVFFNAESYF